MMAYCYGDMCRLRNYLSICIFVLTWNKHACIIVQIVYKCVCIVVQIMAQMKGLRTMNTEEKIKAILEAIASKKVSARKIDVSRKGSTIAAIKRGQTVKPATVDKLYATLLSILAGSEPHETQEKIPPTEEQAKQEPTKDDDSLSTRVEILEGWNVEIKKMLKVS